jgi:hypothetical protein
MRDVVSGPVACLASKRAALNHPSQPLGRALMHDVPSAGPLAPETTRVLAAAGGLIMAHTHEERRESRPRSDFPAVLRPLVARMEGGRKPHRTEPTSGQAVPQIGAESDTSRSFAATRQRANITQQEFGAAVGRPHMVLVAIHCESMFRISIAVPGSPKCPIS